jgi:hypothetical protein
MSSDKVNLAIQECLESCHKSPAPLMALVLYAQELASHLDWTEEELVQVTQQVFPILFRNTQET